MGSLPRCRSRLCIGLMPCLVVVVLTSYGRVCLFIEREIKVRARLEFGGSRHMEINSRLCGASHWEELQAHSRPWLFRYKQARFPFAYSSSRSSS